MSGSESPLRICGCAQRCQIATYEVEFHLLLFLELHGLEGGGAIQGREEDEIPLRSAAEPKCKAPKRQILNILKLDPRISGNPGVQCGKITTTLSKRYLVTGGCKRNPDLFSLLQSSSVFSFFFF